MRSDINRLKILSFLPLIKYEMNSSRNPDVVPAKAGNQYLKDRISPYWIPGQARNDKLLKTCVVMYN